VTSACSLMSLGCFLRASENGVRGRVTPTYLRSFTGCLLPCFTCKWLQTTDQNSLAVLLMKTAKTLQDILGVGVFSPGVPTRSCTSR
jgi:hypothetical protein